jgi:hypothetical protein
MNRTATEQNDITNKEAQNIELEIASDGRVSNAIGSADIRV